MKDIILYYDKHCPDTQGFMDYLDEHKIAYTPCDITENMRNIKEFLHWRDTSSLFDKVKEVGAVGVPLICVNQGEDLYLRLPSDPSCLQ